MNKEKKVIKLGTRRKLRGIISGKVKDKRYDAINAARDNTAEALFVSMYPTIAYWVYANIMGNVRRSCFLVYDCC